MKQSITMIFLLLLSMTAFAQSNTAEMMERITKIQNSYPFPTPDGKHLLFHSDRSGNNDIYIQNLSTGKVRQLTDHDENDRTPSVSPNGNTIAFVSTRNGNYDVFTMKIDGTNQINLTNDPDSKDIHPYWSPDGNWIIFNSTNKGNDYDLFIMKPDGSERKKIRNQSGEATHAQFSPDGKKIAFRKFFIEADDAHNSDIAILDLETKKETRATTDKSIDGNPIWSLDGRLLVFTSNRNGKSEYDTSIYSYDVKTKNIERLTYHTSGQEDMTPIYAPNGQSLYFSRWVYEGTIDIFKLDIDQK